MSRIGWILPNQEPGSFLLIKLFLNALFVAGLRIVYLMILPAKGVGSGSGKRRCGMEEVMQMSRCEKCGSRMFSVEEIVTHLEIDGEIVKELGNSGLFNRNCLMCNFPETYEHYKGLDFEKRTI